MNKKNKQVYLKKLGLIAYQKAWNIQEMLFQEIMTIKLRNRKLPVDAHKPTPNYLLFCEHPHVYTLGKSGNEKHLLIEKFQLKDNGTTFHKTNRGGDITYHGPGQLVIYPIIDLANFFTDIHRYLRLLEQAVILTLKDFTIEAGRIKKLTGVWLDCKDSKNARKICALGVRTSRWITMHGLALNVNTDLSYFDHIVPCGIKDKKMTSMEQALRKTQAMKEVSNSFQRHVLDLFEMTLVA